MNGWISSTGQSLCFSGLSMGFDRKSVFKTTYFISSETLNLTSINQSVGVLLQQCNQVCGEGKQTRQVWCQMTHAIPGVLTDILPDLRCDIGSRPADVQTCDAGSCTGAEWMTSQWSGVSRRITHDRNTSSVY